MAESKKRKLTGNKKRFAEEFLIDRNAKQAAIRAGYSVKTAYSQGQRLKKDPLVKEYIDRFTDKQSAKLNLTAERVLEEIAKMAFFNPKDLFNADGSPKAISDLGDDVAAAITGLDVGLLTTTDKNETPKAYIKKFKTSKQAALDMARKYLGLDQTSESHSLELEIKRLQLEKQALELELLKAKKLELDAEDELPDVVEVIVKDARVRDA